MILLGEFLCLFLHLLDVILRRLHIPSIRLDLFASTRVKTTSTGTPQVQDQTYRSFTIASQLRFPVPLALFLLL